MKLPITSLFKYSRRASIAAVTGIVILLIGGSSAYAQHANAAPGSVLYPLKQLWEQGQMLLSFSPASKAQTQLNIAQDRIKAAQDVVSQTPAATNGSNALTALQQAQEHLQKALDSTSNISDKSQKSELDKSISDAAKEAQKEAETEAEKDKSSSDSSSSNDAQNTANQIQQIQTQASKDD